MTAPPEESLAVPGEREIENIPTTRGPGCVRCHYTGIVTLEATRMGEHYFDMPAPCPDCHPDWPKQ